MKKFSIVMPVRNNIAGLLVTLGAFELFTSDKRGLEVFLMVDDDDKDMTSYKRLQNKYSYDVTVVEVTRTDNFSDGYYNLGARMSSGENIWVFNDDCYVQTNKWDKIILDKIKANSHFNGIYMVSTMDSTFNDTPETPFPRFPIISRKAVDTLGFFFVPTIRQWPADKAIYEIYHACGCIITAHEVKLQHDHNYNHNTDPSKNRMLRIMKEDMANGVFPYDGSEHVKALYKAITGKDIDIERKK